jgi:hypothetical protein
MGQPVRQDSNSIDLASNISLSDIYTEALASMRATDDISLRLLAAVPFVSGVGISLIVRQPSDNFPPIARLFVSLFAAVVTFAIYRWERRNMSHCRRLRNCAGEIEKAYLHSLPVGAGTELMEAPHADSLSSRFLSRTWGKTQAEALLYLTVIMGWLATGLYVLAR